MRRGLFCGIGLLILALGQRSVAASVADFQVFSFTDGATTLLPGRLYVPPEASAGGGARPLMVFLHGAGAVGGDNVTQIGPNHTPDYMLEQAKQRGAYLYVPQTSSGWSSAAVLDRVMAMIDRAVADLNADNERLYVIGSSLGGGGVWNLLSRHSNRFAAALSAAGVSPAAGFAPARLLGTGVIAVHARDDGVVSVNSSRSVVNGILAAAGETQPAYLPLSSQAHWALWNPALATHRSIMDAVPPGANVATVSISQPELDLFYYELPAGGHSVSAGAFYHPLIYEWMFAHGVPEPASSAMAGLAAAGMLSRARKRRTGRGESAARRRSAWRSREEW